MGAVSAKSSKLTSTRTALLALPAPSSLDESTCELVLHQTAKLQIDPALSSALPRPLALCRSSQEIVLSQPVELEIDPA